MCMCICHSCHFFCPCSHFAVTFQYNAVVAPMTGASLTAAYREISRFFVESLDESAKVDMGFSQDELIRDCAYDNVQDCTW